VVPAAMRVERSAFLFFMLRLLAPHGALSLHSGVPEQL